MKLLSVKFSKCFVHWFDISMLNENTQVPKPLKLGAYPRDV